MRFQIKAVFVVWTLLTWTQLVGPATAAEPEKVTGKAGVLESFKFDPDDRAIVIPVRVRATNYPFVVDTGLTVNIFDVSLRAHLGTRVGVASAHTPGGDVEIDRYSAPDARVGSLPLTASPVFCHDFTLMREGIGRSVYGSVGMDFL